MTPLKKFLILLVIPLMAFTMHKYYISLTQINYNPTEKSLHITMRLFIDDLEKSLEANFNEKFNLDTPNENKKTSKYIAYYLNSNFEIKVNDKKLNIKFLGKEYEDNVVYFYIEIDSVPVIKSIAVQNTMLMNTFETQQNIIKLNMNNQKKTMILNHVNDKDLLKF
jgi:hypothetical protein